MAVPKKRKPYSKTRMVRSHDALKTVNWVEDKTSGEPVRRHHVDLKTGMYKGRQVIEQRD